MNIGGFEKYILTRLILMKTLTFLKECLLVSWDTNFFLNINSYNIIILVDKQIITESNSLILFSKTDKNQTN